MFIYDLLYEFNFYVISLDRNSYVISYNVDF